MGTSTFSGPVRSEAGFRSIVKDGDTGVITSVDDQGAGTGITTGTGTVYAMSVTEAGGLIHTQIFIDITGLADGGTANDIIGKDGGTANCHIGQITAGINGTIIAGTMTCLEAPTTGDPDIDLYSGDEATGAENAAVTGLTNDTQLVNAGDATLGSVVVLTAFPAADQYLYLVAATNTGGVYDAGKLLIDLYGYNA